MILKNLFIYGCSGLHCCSWLSLVLASGGYSLVVVYGPLISVASLNEEYRLYEQGFQLLWIVGLVVADGRL